MSIVTTKRTIVTYIVCVLFSNVMTWQKAIKPSMVIGLNQKTIWFLPSLIKTQSKGKIPCEGCKNFNLAEFGARAQ